MQSDKTCRDRSDVVRRGYDENRIIMYALIDYVTILFVCKVLFLVISKLNYGILGLIEAELQSILSIVCEFITYFISAIFEMIADVIDNRVIVAVFYSSTHRNIWFLKC